MVPVLVVNGTGTGAVLRCTGTGTGNGTGSGTGTGTGSGTGTGNGTGTVYRCNVALASRYRLPAVFQVCFSMADLVLIWC